MRVPLPFPLSPALVPPLFGVSLQWMTVFSFAMAEIFVLLILLTPLPRRWRLWLSGVIASIPRRPTISLLIKVAFVILLGLFADSIREVFGSMEAAMITPQDALFQTRAFRAQRNAYMTGVALLLMGLLNRVYKYITAALQAEAEVSILKTQLRDVTAQLSVALSGKAEIQNKYDMVRRYAKRKRKTIYKLSDREILSEDTVREVPSTQ